MVCKNTSTLNELLTLLPDLKINGPKMLNVFLELIAGVCVLARLAMAVGIQMAQSACEPRTMPVEWAVSVGMLVRTAVLLYSLILFFYSAHYVGTINQKY